jgi:hypothetical protein
LNAIAEANSPAPGIAVTVSIPTKPVIAFMEQIIDLYGCPQAIRCDCGSEFARKAFTAWCKTQHI